MSILTPSLLSSLALGVLFCPALARTAEGLLDGTGLTDIPTFELSAVPGWWLSARFAEYPTGTAALLALFFLSSLLFFSVQQGKERGDDGGVLGSARIKTGPELIKGSVTWNGKSSPEARGFVYGFYKGKYLFEPERHVLLDGSTGAGKTRFCLNPTIDLLTYGNGGNGSEPSSITLTDVKNELIELTGPELERRGYEVLLLDTQNPYRGHRFNPISLVARLMEEGDLQGAERAADAIAMTLSPKERGQGSSHWPESSRGGCSALMLLVASSGECPAKAKHLATANEVLCVAPRARARTPPGRSRRFSANCPAGTRPAATPRSCCPRAATSSAASYRP